MENKEKEIDLLLIIKNIWKQRKQILIWGCFGLVTSIVIALSIPKEYTSKIKLVPEVSSASSSGSMGALAGMMGVDIRTAQKGTIKEDLYPEIFKSTPFLMEFANIEVPYQNQNTTLAQYLLKEQSKAWWSYLFSAPSNFIGWISSLGGSQEEQTIENSQAIREAFVNILSSKVNVKSDKKTQIIEITSRMQSPEISLIVVDSLFTKLQRYVTAYKTQKARQNLQMSTVMLKEAKEEYEKADSIYSYALDRNLNIISKVLQSKVDKLKNEQELRYNVYQQLASQIMIDAIKLHEETPIAVVLDPAKLPLMPSGPNAKLIIIVLTFLAMFAKVGAIVVKEFLRK